MAVSLLLVTGLSAARDKDDPDDTLSHAVAERHAEPDKPIVALDADGEFSNRLLHALDALGDDYEPRTEHRFDFQREKLAPYEQTVRLSATAPPGDTHALRLPASVQWQACNDETCLAPETLVLNVPAASAGH